MSEYIERDALISELKTLPEQERIEYMGIYDCIRSMPTPNVAEVKHGKWVEKVRKGFGAFSGRCSKCKKYSGLWVVNEPYRFCPYCGAEMDLGDDGT